MKEGHIFKQMLGLVVQMEAFLPSFPDLVYVMSSCRNKLCIWLLCYSCYGRHSSKTWKCPDISCRVFVWWGCSFEINIFSTLLDLEIHGVRTKEVTHNGPSPLSDLHTFRLQVTTESRVHSVCAGKSSTCLETLQKARSSIVCAEPTFKH